MKRNQATRGPDRSGVILLLVLGSLTFFSVLVATYLVFANDSRDSSSALNSRSTRAPDINWMMNEALMTLVRGTDDVNHPFYGESLLDDYYGRDGVSMRVKHVNSFAVGPFFIGNGFVRFPISTDGAARQAGLRPLNDMYSGRTITFTEGPLKDQTYRILRSVYRPPAAPITEYDDVFIDLKQEVFGNTTPTAAAVRSLFYDDPADLTVGAFRFHLNGAPRNARGIGYEVGSRQLSVTTGTDAQQPTDPSQPFHITNNPQAGYTLPVSLQPNHLGRNVDKSTIAGDYDEDYDVADHLNWFLSHRRADGTVIPSFHRPAVLNYIINQANYDSSASSADFQNLLASLARGTFRPLPIAAGELGTVPAVGATPAYPSPAVNERFTGGSNVFALRVPLRMSGGPNPALLHQLVDALINGEWDVDNDADGIPDSIWVDLGLPMFTSREGKLLRPLVAPMIEDLSARLNLNAHSTRQLAPQVAGLNSEQAFWAGTRAPFGDVANRQFVFRGLGWGPAEITLPMTSSSGVIGDATVLTDLNQWFNQRYRFGEQPLAAIDEPGRTNRDALDLLRFGYRPPFHRTIFGFGHSTDPFGRGGVAMGRSGHLVSAASGLAISNASPVINEAVNNPYESDPSGELSGDRAAMLADLEVILRSNDFDSELLPTALQERLRRLFAYPTGPVPPGQEHTYGEHARSYTTRSVSDDSPPTVRDTGATSHLSLIGLIEQIAGATYTQAQWAELLAPELRLGHKIDVNRRVGNGIDDNGNNVIDEPLEVTRADNDTVDNNGNGTTDEPGEVLGESQAFVSFNPAVGTIPADFNNQSPNYTFEEPASPVGDVPISGRQLLARHLYVLMMALSRDLNTPATEPDFPSVAATPPASFDAAAYKARRLAQWAVNAVDYSDPDSINTRFVFDVDPFDAGGWDPPADTVGAPAPPTNIVWGVEAPQMVFSEGGAWHDVRLRDIDRDDGDGRTKTDMPNPDDDSDQVRMPQGSLFLELYCPHPVISGDQTTHPGAPQELYNTVAGTGASELDLTRAAPSPAAGGPGAPVWRIALTSRHDVPSGNQADALSELRNTIPDSASFEIDVPDELDTTAGNLSYSRFIWFRDFEDGDVNPDAAFALIDNLINNNNLAAEMQANQVFYAPAFDGDAVTNSDRALAPGQYLVLAPRPSTRFGSKEFAGAVPGLPSDQQLTIDPAEGLIQARHDNTRLTPGLTGPGDPYAPALPMVIAAPRPTGWIVPSAANPNFVKNMVGLSVSEPLPRGGNYYPQPTHRYNGTQDVDGDGNEDYLLTDAYIDFSDPATNALDEPLDVTRGLIPVEMPNAQGGIEPTLGTTPNYCSALLQRLADPTIPYHPTLNPYRTVDWMPIDLSVFSGEERPDNVSIDRGYTRRTRQRNGFVREAADPVGGTPVAANALFSYETDFDDSAPTTLDTTVPEFFQFFSAAGTPDEQHLNSSFSFLNTGTANINPNFVGFTASLGSLGSPASDNIVGNDRNLPQAPFAVHSWLNRPFASHFELMMVPACSQGRLFDEFTFDPTASPNIYPVSGAPPIDPAVFNAPFRYLLNFFHSSSDSGAGAEFARVFDYVHTLPRYRGEVDVINPQRLTSTVPAEEAQLALMRSVLAPPFNKVYDNQRQARVNLNTLAEFPVWAGLMQGHQNPQEFSGRAGAAGTADQLSFDRMVHVRRGYPSAGGPGTTITPTDVAPYNYDTTNLDPRFPTEFGGVFRSGTMTPPTIPLRDPAAQALLRRRPVNGTLLRGWGNLQINEPPGAGAPPVQSMFVRDDPQLPLAASRPQHDRLRNPFMRYQTLMRMPNLVSDNSQVFVIRLTLGFFEVDAQTQGLQNEYNADVGQNERYQATFVVDRSLPVGFIPGENTNARDIVIFESYAQ